MSLPKVTLRPSENIWAEKTNSFQLKCYQMLPWQRPMKDWGYFWATNWCCSMAATAHTGPGNYIHVGQLCTRLFSTKANIQCPCRKQCAPFCSKPKVRVLRLGWWIVLLRQGLISTGDRADMSPSLFKILLLQFYSCGSWVLQYLLIMFSYCPTGPKGCFQLKQYHAFVSSG